MIYTTIDTVGQFSDAFHRMGRGTQFSYEALGALYQYLEDMGDDYELDVICLCCEFCEVFEGDEDYERYCDEHDYLHDNVVALLENSVLVRA